MRRIASAVLACSLMVTAGCSTRPVVVATKPLWPFEQLEIRTSVGSVHGYLSRPEASTERLVVTLQRSPCAGESSAGQAREVVGTSGLLWRQFREDSVFFQFEKPGTGSQAQIACERASGNDDEDLLRAVVDSVRALRRQEQLDDVPTSYLGIGAGAAVALQAAARDKRAEFVALVSAILDANTAAAIGELEKTSRSRRLPVVILHAAEDSRTSLPRARQLLARLTSAGLSASMLILAGADFDLGLVSQRTDCLEIAAEALSERVRSKQAASGTTTVSCSASETDEPTRLQIERIDKHEPR